MQRRERIAVRLVIHLRATVDGQSRRLRLVIPGRLRQSRANKTFGLGVGALPTGAFYALANARRFTGDSLRFAFDILEATHVATTPGVDFGKNAEGYLRFAYANSLERIEEGLAGGGTLSLDDMTSIQADDVSLLGQKVVPWAVGLLEGRTLSAGAAGARDLIAAWGGLGAHAPAA